MKEIVFDVTNISKHDAVLGMPWLERHDPEIDWKNRKLHFKRCFCPRDRWKYNTPGLFASSEDEEHDKEVHEASTAVLRHPDIQSEELDPKAAEHLGSGQAAATRAMIAAVATTIQDVVVLPTEYREFRKLFEEQETGTQLPTHQPWDYEIPLKPGKKPSFGPIYSMSEKELLALREYLDEIYRKDSFDLQTVTCRPPDHFYTEERRQATTLRGLQAT